MEPRTGLRILFIGFNRCGTTALHRLLAKSGVNSLHFRVRNGPHLASRLFTNFSLDLPLLTGLEDYEAFSDMNLMRHGMMLEGHRLFRDLHRHYPEACFVLNTRDKDKWLASRSNHAVRDGTMIDYVQSIHDLTADQVRDLWSSQWDQHHEDVEAYFASVPARFLRFDIEQDDISKLAAFLAPEVTLSLKDWKQRNIGPATRAVS